MSNFPFVDNQILKENLDQSLAHIVDLLTLTESKSYQAAERKLLVSSIRKTIIIHTASIIEALLCWKLEKEVSSGKIQLKGDWIYQNIKILFKFENDENKREVIGAIRRKPSKTIKDLDFYKMIEIAYKKEIVTTEEIYKDLHNVRKLRNRVHLASLHEPEREYSKTDLEFCFDVAKRIKNRLAKTDG